MASRTACFWHHALVSLLAIFSTAAQALTPSQVFKSVKDSVVVIQTLDAGGNEIAMGSGVLLPSGSVATNCHVIKNGTAFKVGRGTRFVDAIVYAGNNDKDICLLKTNGISGTPAVFGKAANLIIGEVVYAIGAPQGLELSLSNGIVSQLRSGSPPLIQTTAAISPGSSGGGLFDSQARLVGLTTAHIKGGQNLNFAVPVEWLTQLELATEQLRKRNLEQKTSQDIQRAQRIEAMSANVRSSLHRALADTAVTRTAFRDPADEAAWLTEMSRRLAMRMPDETERIEFLNTLHWESSRAGVDPQLMLGLIQTVSDFQKYAVSPVGARGYTQVMPFWVKAIGSPTHNLFQLRTNLRYGALILRHYIDIENGDLFRALGRYNGSPGQSEFPSSVVGAWKRHWDYSVGKHDNER